MDPTPPPEGELIETARKRASMSQNKAAKRAGISGTRWRQIVKGVASGGRGIEIPAHGNAETVARMAQAVGVTAEELSEVERDDAAAEMAAIGAYGHSLAPVPSDAEVFTDPKEQALWELDALTVAERVDHIAKVRVNRVMQQQREENEALSAEITRLRQENARLLAEMERLRGDGRRAG